MKINQIKELIKEAIQTIFEADIKYNEGDRVEIDSSYGGGIGTIALAKHPFYAIKFDQTGTTDSFHFSDLRPFNDEEEEEKNADIDTGLNENVLLHENIKTSSNLKYHLNKKLPLNENIFRYGSDAQLELFKEARELYNKGLLYLNAKDRWLVENTDIGEYGEFEGKLVPLDVPMIEEGIKGEDKDKVISIINKLMSTNKLTDQDVINNLMNYINHPQSNLKGFMTMIQTLNESKDNKPLNKPKRDSSGGKAYKVYVKDPKTKKIKTVRFGSGGLKAKINNPKARQAFAKRHNCARKNDKTKASYWSCRLPRYAQALGLKSSFSGFW
jgi:hypothetical protein